MGSEKRFERLTPPWIALLLFLAAGLLDALHGYVGYRLAGQPEVGYTLRGQPLGFFELAARSMPSWIVLGTLAALAIRFAERRPIFATDWKRSLLLHVPLALVFSATFLIFAALFRYYLFVGPETDLSLRATLLRYYMLYFNTHFLWYWGIVGVYSGFIHYRHLRERDIRAEKLQRQLTEARLRVLQQQLEPHFLFNTLNAVSGLALEGNITGTVRTLALLGELLRATLHTTGQVITIRRELELLEMYLDLQRIRLEERLDVRTEIEPDILDVEIPTFLLQPLVENAIRHGVAPEAGNGWILIRISRRGERVHMTITDSGRGFETQELELGVGIGNSIARLTELYGQDYLFELKNAREGGACATVEWPCRRVIPTGNESQVGLGSFEVARI